MDSIQKILVPFDFEPSSTKALDVAIELAKLFGAELTVLHVWEVPAYAYSGFEFSTLDLLAPVRAAAQQHLEQALVEFDERLPGIKRLLRGGTAWYEIRDAIRDVSPDLVVMGTHGRRGFNHLMLGSVAEKTVRSSAVPVLTVHPEDPAPQEKGK
jgi:nucleotide-binding universal stress UspA family protein